MHVVVSQLTTSPQALQFFEPNHIYLLTFPWITPKGNLCIQNLCLCFGFGFCFCPFHLTQHEVTGTSCICRCQSALAYVCLEDLRMQNQQSKNALFSSFRRTSHLSLSTPDNLHIHLSKGKRNSQPCCWASSKAKKLFWSGWPVGEELPRTAVRIPKLASKNHPAHHDHTFIGPAPLLLSHYALTFAFALSTSPKHEATDWSLFVCFLNVRAHTLAHHS